MSFEDYKELAQTYIEDDVSLHAFNLVNRQGDLPGDLAQAVTQFRISEKTLIELLNHYGISKKRFN